MQPSEVLFQIKLDTIQKQVKAKQLLLILIILFQVSVLIFLELLRVREIIVDASGDEQGSYKLYRDDVLVGEGIFTASTGHKASIEVETKDSGE